MYKNSLHASNKYYLSLVAGFVSNGEYNSMRAKGYTRPLSILQIKAEARAKYSSSGIKAMLEMLTPVSKYLDVHTYTLYNAIYTPCIYVGQKDGKILPLRPNAAVPTQLLTEILQWREDGVLEDDIISRLRTRTVPPGYPIHSWKKGENVCMHV